jgi:predicted acyl esterase
VEIVVTVDSGILPAGAPELELILTGKLESQPLAEAPEIDRETAWVEMRDGIRLATDLYLPPGRPAPAIVMRTPYGRAVLAESFLGLARRGYVVVAQDCRGTGDSEPDLWDFAIFEVEDSIDCVAWITQQPWFDGFLGALGGSYVGWTQWCMAMHPSMSAIAPEVAGLGVSPQTGPNTYMFVNSYSRSAFKGVANVPLGFAEMERRMWEETLAGGYFNEPLYTPFSEALLDHYPELRSLPPAEGQRWLYEQYRALAPAQRADLLRLALGEASFTFQGAGRVSAIFGHKVPRTGYLFPRARDDELFASLHAPALVITGWYDWGLGDTLATWELLTRETRKSVRFRSRLLISPSAHNMPGYRESRERHPELDRVYRSAELLELLVHWYAAVREDTLDGWPPVIYYLMGANQWRTASGWPLPGAERHELYLGPHGTLTVDPPDKPAAPDRYTYDPGDPTPTVGGSIVSSVYTPGSVDVSEVQQRSDVLTYTTAPLASDLDVIGPLGLVLYASSSAVDTDFSARLSDVFPDGRAIQLQSVTLRARYRHRGGTPALLEPSRTYRLEIDLWATANRFKAGHRLRLDISSADFPKFDRNTNRGGEPGPAVRAEQAIYHDPDHPSRLILSIIGSDRG